MRVYVYTYGIYVDAIFSLMLSGWKKSPIPLFPIPLLTSALFRRSHTSHQNVDVEIWVAPEQSGSNDAFGERWMSKRWTELYLATAAGKGLTAIRRLSVFASSVADTSECCHRVRRKRHS